MGIETINWDAIGAVAELIGSVAVVATIGYLAAQIRQTNRSAESDTLNALHDKFNALNGILLHNPDLHGLLTKEGSLSDDERERVYTFANMLINAWVNVQTAYDNGQIGQRLYRGMRNDVDVAMRRWPNFHAAVRTGLANYPEVAHLEIFGSYGGPRSDADGRADLS